MGQKEITVVACHPGQRASIQTIDASLSGMQKFVGGLIEAVYPWNEPVCIVCNDEGKINGMELNRALRDENGRMYDIVAGSFFIADCSGENFGSLSQEQQQRYLKKFEKPEQFFNLGGRIIAVPMEEQGKRQTETQKTHRPKM